MSLARNVGKIVGKGMKVSDGLTNSEKNVNVTKKALGAIGKGVKYPFHKADQLVDKGLDIVEAGGSKALNSSVGQKLKIKERLSPLTNKKDKDGNVIKSWDNLYTGKKLNPLYSTVGVGAIVASTYAQVQADRFMAPITSSKRNVEQGGAPEIMLYDGVGQQSAPSHLNANGNLVFGLHNQRKG